MHKEISSVGLTDIQCCPVVYETYSLVLKNQGFAVGPSTARYPTNPIPAKTQYGLLANQCQGSALNPLNYLDTYNVECDISPTIQQAEVSKTQTAKQNRVWNN